MTPMQRLDLLKAACCVAGVDGKGPPEEKIVDRLAREIGVGDASLNAMMSRAERDPDFCKDQFRILKEEPAECMGLLLQVALADGVLSDEEILVLEKLSSQLGIAPNVFDNLILEAKKIVGEKSKGHSPVQTGEQK